MRKALGQLFSADPLAPYTEDDEVKHSAVMVNRVRATVRIIYSILVCCWIVGYWVIKAEHWAIVTFSLSLTLTLWLYEVVRIVVTCTQAEFQNPWLPFYRKGFRVGRKTWQYFFTGVSVADVRSREGQLGTNIRLCREGIAALGHLGALVEAEVAYLIRLGRSNDARMLVAKAYEEARRQQDAQDALRSRAHDLGCLAAVDRRLVLDDVEAAEQVIVTVQSLRRDAAQVDLSPQVLAFIEREQFADARNLIAAEQRRRRKRDAHDSLKKRIDALEFKHRGGLHRMLQKLAKLDFEGRDHRKATYELEQAIEKAAQKK